MFASYATRSIAFRSLTALRGCLSSLFSHSLTSPSNSSGAKERILEWAAGAGLGGAIDKSLDEAPRAGTEKP
jgi:hypothetical protein